MKRSFVIFLIFLVMQLVCSAVLMLLLNIPNLTAHRAFDINIVQSYPAALCGMMVAASALTVGSLWLTRLVRRNFMPRTSVHHPSLKGAGWAIASIASMAFAQSLLLTPFGLDDGGSTRLFQEMSQSAPLFILAVCVLGPLTEELVFREGILRSLSLSGTAPWLALVVSSVVFAVTHLNFYQSLPALISGLLLGMFFLGTGDVRLSFLGHLVNNSLGVLSFYLPQMEKSMNALPLWQSLAGGAFLLLMSVTFLYIWWHRRPAYSFKEEMRAENPAVLF